MGGPKPLLFHKFTAVIILSANFEGGHGRIGPPWIRTSRGAESGPLWTPRFSSSRGAVQRSRGAAAYPGCMVIRALLQIQFQERKALHNNSTQKRRLSFLSDSLDRNIVAF